MDNAPHRLKSLALAAALAALGAACDTLPMFEKARFAEEVTGSVTPAPQRLQPGEKLKILVYGEDRLTGDFEIDAGGKITVPMIGAVQAADLTKVELEKALVSRLKSAQILKNPVVSVDVAALRPFYVLGEVEKPGQYPFVSGLNVMSAAAVAGGYTYRASKSRVLVQRAGEKAFREYPISPDVLIFPGDLISVPERYF